LVKVCELLLLLELLQGLIKSLLIENVGGSRILEVELADNVLGRLLLIIRAVRAIVLLNHILPLEAEQEFLI
jgi:hypothetical protein